jgi:hypothetical protein
MIEIQRLKESLSYNPLTGILTWKVRPLHHFPDARAHKSWNSHYSLKETGCIDPNGYLRVNILGTPYLAHQLIWALHYGEYTDFIDHINLDPSDNRISNLRKCTLSQNQHNRTISKNNKSGYKGVCWNPKTSKWRAYIVLNWKQKHLGFFDDIKKAHEAYCHASDLLHGEFSNHGTKA